MDDLMNKYSEQINQHLRPIGLRRAMMYWDESAESRYFPLVTQNFMMYEDKFADELERSALRSSGHGKLLKQLYHALAKIGISHETKVREVRIYDNNQPLVRLTNVAHQGLGLSISVQLYHTKGGHSFERPSRSRWFTAGAAAGLVGGIIAAMSFLKYVKQNT